MSPQMKDVFEDFLKQNHAVNNFVQAALRGKCYLGMLSESAVPYPINQVNSSSNEPEFIQIRRGLNAKSIWNRLKHMAKGI